MHEEHIIVRKIDGVEAIKMYFSPEDINFMIRALIEHRRKQAVYKFQELEANNNEQIINNHMVGCANGYSWVNSDL